MARTHVNNVSFMMPTHTQPVVEIVSVRADVVLSFGSCDVRGRRTEKNHLSVADCYHWREEWILDDDGIEGTEKEHTTVIAEAVYFGVPSRVSPSLYIYGTLTLPATTRARSAIAYTCDSV